MAFYTVKIDKCAKVQKELRELDWWHELPKWFYTTNEWSRYVVDRMRLLSELRECSQDK